MYVTSSKPPTYSRLIGYMGSGFRNDCKFPVTPRYYSGQTLLHSEAVTSWRGKRTSKDEPHDFERTLFDVKHREVAPVWTCTSGYLDGGPSWALCLPIHNLMRPKLAWGLDRVNAVNVDDYREYMIQGLFAKANSPAVSIAISLAEGMESLEYITKRLMDIVRITQSMSYALINSRDLTRQIVANSNPANAWLEWRYAILPLMLEVENWLSLLKGKNRKKEKIQDGFKEVTYSHIGHSFSFNNSRIPATYNFMSSYKTSIRGGCGLVVRFQQDLAPFGTGIYDIIQAGWERTMLSFVVDWFVDIGQWLAAFRDTKLDYINGYATIVIEEEVDIIMTSSVGTTILNAIGHGADSMQTYAYKMSRKAGIEPSALPRIQPLILKWYRKVDAIALLTGVLTGLAHQILNKRK